MAPSLGSTRRQAQDSYREYIAIYALVHGGISPQDYERLRLSIDSVDQLPRQKAIDVATRIEGEIGEMRHRYGVTEDSATLLSFLDDIEAAPPEQEEAWIAKAQIATLASRYGDAFEGFDRLPMHGRIGFSLKRERDGRHAFELWLLEGKLFEDMCALFNLARAHQPLAERRESTKADVKKADAMNRSVVLSAFDFVEAYLNGIAADYFLQHGHTLAAETKALLLEWDDARQRSRHFSLRDKALQYPRIYVGAAHPPVQESNCPPLAVILDAKVVRDSIAHPSSLLAPGSVTKELPFFSLSAADVERIVDNAIALVRAIEAAIDRRSLLLDWMRDRTEDGLFPDTVFD